MEADIKKLLKIPTFLRAATEVADSMGTTCYSEVAGIQMAVEAIRALKDKP